MGLLDELDRLSKDVAEQDPVHYSNGYNAVAGPSKSIEKTSKQDVVVCRDEEHLPLKTLQSQVAQYGFRPGNRRSVLLRQLEDVRRALEEKADQDTSFSSSMFSSSPPQLLSSPERPLSRVVGVNRGTREAAFEDFDPGAQQTFQPDRTNGRDSHETTNSSYDAHSDVVENDESCDSASSGTSDDGAGPSARPSLTKRLSAGVARANETPLGIVPAAVAKQLLEAVQSDEDVYRRILHFEPISFDEISSLAKRANVQGLRNKEMLRNWLDVQCICFYTAELTGQRQRY